MSTASKVMVVLWKDVVSELRSKEIATSVLVFGILILVIFSFAFDPESGAMGLISSGILWVAITFSGVLALNRTFAAEKENNCLDGILLCPVGRDVLYWGKLSSSFVFMLIVEAIITPVFLVLFDQPLWMPRLVLIIVLATVGFAAVGTLFSALSANTRARDIMLPILFFPIVSPLIIAAVESTALAMDGRPWAEMVEWLGIMAAFDAIFLVVSTLVFEYVVEE